MIPAFTVSPHVAAKYQDQIAAHMLASIPRQFRAIPDRVYALADHTPAFLGTRASAGKFAAERAEMTPHVLRMRDARMPQREIADALGVSRYRIGRIIAEAGA